MKMLKYPNKRPQMAALLLLSIYLAGCAAPAVIQQEAPAPAKAPAPLSMPGQTHHGMPALAGADNEGSLWVDDGSLSEMFINAKARRVGDILTIKIVESSKATNNASTNTGRTTSMAVGLSSLFNLEQNFSANSIFNPFGTAQSDYESEFDGSGTTARSGALTAYITARIIQVLPNGNFIIEGNREVRINNENQIITLTGLVRPRDIAASNVILSTYIADARISYSGSGVLNDQQRPGWLARLLDSIWPF
jgi:flagellar L-ring protein precursor FlgH